MSKKKTFSLTWSCTECKYGGPSDGPGLAAWKRGYSLLHGGFPSKFWSSRVAACALSEDDIPGASLAGREPATLKNEEHRLWLKCRGDSLKGFENQTHLAWIRYKNYSELIQFLFSSIEDWRLYKVWPWSEHCRSRSEQDLHEKETTQRSGEQRHQFECFRWITTEVSIWWLVYRSHQNAKNLHSRRNEWTYIKVKEKYWLQHPHPLYFNEC